MKEQWIWNTAVPSFFQIIGFSVVCYRGIGQYFDILFLAEFYL